MKTGYQVCEENMNRHARKNRSSIGFLAVILATTVSTAASAMRYPNCILPASQVVISPELDEPWIRKCIDTHLAVVAGAEAAYFQMKGEFGLINLDAAQANIAVIDPATISNFEHDVALLVTAVGSIEATTLSTGGDYKELSMKAAKVVSGNVEVIHEMGQEQYLSTMGSLKFAAAPMAEQGNVQHFHLVGVNCN